MHQRIASMPEPGSLLAAAFTLPLFSLMLAIVVAAVVLFLTRRMTSSGVRSGADPSSATDPVGSAPLLARIRRERRTLGIGAVAVIVLFMTENVIRGYLLPLADVVAWWTYATLVFAASCAVAVLMFAIVSTSSSHSERPATPQARRTWTSFTVRWELVCAVLTFVALAGVTLAAGLVSSTDADGRSIYLAIPFPNTDVDPIRPWFYGWAFGLPVLVCLAVLVALTWAVLYANAARPFLGVGAAARDRTARIRIASGIVRIASAGVLLALAGALRFIYRAGSISAVGIGDGNDAVEPVWRYAEFGALGGVIAPLLEIIAFVALILVAIDSLRPVRRVQSAQGEPQARVIQPGQRVLPGQRDIP